MDNLKQSQIILIVDDYEEDYMAIQRIFQKVQLLNPIFWCKSGQEALDYLRHEGAYKDTEKHAKPGLILLDLKMPGMDGHRTLQTIRADPELKDIPVIILTTSGSDRDITASSREGADAYVQKPVTFEGLLGAIHGLKEFWFEISLMSRK
jgi:CheY-like chemotaxis protein